VWEWGTEKKEGVRNIEEMVEKREQGKKKPGEIPDQAKSRLRDAPVGTIQKSRSFDVKWKGKETGLVEDTKIGDS